LIPGGLDMVGMANMGRGMDGRFDVSARQVQGFRYVLPTRPDWLGSGRPRCRHGQCGRLFLPLMLLFTFTFTALAAMSQPSAVRKLELGTAVWNNCAIVILLFVACKPRCHNVDPLPRLNTAFIGAGSAPLFQVPPARKPPCRNNRQQSPAFYSGQVF
jgi:hypothetical protein